MEARGQRFTVHGKAGDVAAALASRLAELAGAALATVERPTVELVHPDRWHRLAADLATRFGYKAPADVPCPLVTSDSGRVIGSAHDAVTFFADSLGISCDLDPPALRERAAAHMAAASAEQRQRDLLESCLHKRRALIIVDVQRDFCEGGSLAVPDGDAVIEVVNGLRERWNWDMVVLTQDWHPADHISFSSNNPGTSLFETVDLPGVGPQVMWPDHCVQGSAGAEFHPALVTKLGRVLQAGDDAGEGPSPDDERDTVIRKGTVRRVDSYSGFGDASEDKSQERTPLASLLRSRGVEVAVVVGLAQDFCVAFTAKDAVRSGFETMLVLDGTRGITPEGIASEMELCRAEGVRLMTLDEVPTAALEGEVRAAAGLKPWERFGEDGPAAGEGLADAGSGDTAGTADA